MKKTGKIKGIWLNKKCTYKSWRDIQFHIILGNANITNNSFINGSSSKQAIVSGYNITMNTSAFPVDDWAKANFTDINRLQLTKHKPYCIVLLPFDDTPDNDYAAFYQTDDSAYGFISTFNTLSSYDNFSQLQTRAGRTTNMNLTVSMFVQSVSSDNVLELEENTYKLDLLNIAGSTITAALVYNNTHYTATSTSDSTYINFSRTITTPAAIGLNNNYTFYWNYNVTVGGTSEYSTDTVFNQSIYAMTVYPCNDSTLGNIGTLNFTLYDETTDAAINGNADVTFEIWKTAQEDYKNISFNYSNKGYFDVCIYPTWTSFYTDALVQYEGLTGTAYLQRNYNILNATLTNITNDINLYLNNGTRIVAAVYDESNNPVENAYIFVQSYDVSTGSYKIKEIVETNFEGKAQMSLVKYTQFYRFLIYYPSNTLKKSTTPTYIYEDTITFSILIGEDVADKYYTTQDVDYSLTFNNATNNFKFIYVATDSSVSQGCLEIYLETKTDSVLYNSSCVSGTSSTILLGVNNQSGTTYQAKAYVHINGVKYFIDGLYKVYEEVSEMGNLGVLVIVILTILLCCVFIWDKSIALIITPLPLFFGSILNIVDFSIGILLGVEVIFIIIAVVISKRD